MSILKCIFVLSCSISAMCALAGEDEHMTVTGSRIVNGSGGGGGGGHRGGGGGGHGRQQHCLDDRSSEVNSIEVDFRCGGGRASSGGSSGRGSSSTGELSNSQLLTLVIEKVGDSVQKLAEKEMWAELEVIVTAKDGTKYEVRLKAGFGTSRVTSSRKL